MTSAYARLAVALTIVLATGHQPAWSGGKLDAETMKRYGGTYLSDCKNPTSARVTILETTLVFLQGEQRIVGNILPAGEGVDWFGRLTPEHFQITLEAALANGQHMYFLVYDDKGPYLTVEADAKLAKEIGQRYLTLKYHRCDAKQPRQ